MNWTSRRRSPPARGWPRTIASRVVTNRVGWVFVQNHQIHRQLPSPVLVRG
jgi:hypothetical protein